MIQSFADALTEDIWNGVRNARTRGFPQNLLASAQRKLALVHRAVTLADLAALPGNALEALKGDLKGYHSIRINSQWRITFKWTNAGPESVCIQDYH